MSEENYTNCLKCPHSQVLQDPDPTDSFNYDDKAVVCTLTPNDKIDRNSKYTHDHFEHKPVTVLCRPYRLEEESDIPLWCPISKQNKIKNNLLHFDQNTHDLLQSQLGLLMSEFMVAYIKDNDVVVSEKRKEINAKIEEASSLGYTLCTTLSFPHKGEQIEMRF